MFGVASLIAARTFGRCIQILTLIVLIIEGCLSQPEFNDHSYEGT